jgi:hypothetical protein
MQRPCSLSICFRGRSIDAQLTDAPTQPPSAPITHLRSGLMTKLDKMSFVLSTVNRLIDHCRGGPAFFSQPYDLPVVLEIRRGWAVIELSRRQIDPLDELLVQLEQ